MFQYLSKLWYLLSGWKVKLALLSLAFTIASVFETFSIGLLSPFINLASNPSLDTLPPFILQGANRFNIDSSSELLLVLGLAIIVFYCIKSLLYFSTHTYIFHFGSEYNAKLASRLLSSYLKVPYEFHLNRNTAGLIKNIVIEAEHFCYFCILPLLNSISNFIVICFLLLLLAITDLRLLIMILAILLPIFILFNLFGYKFKQWGQTASQSKQEMILTVNHAIGGLKETRVIGCESYFEQEMNRCVKQYARSITFFQSSQLLPKIFIETALIVFVISFIMISQLLSTQSMQELTGILGVFAVAAMRLIPSASQLLAQFAKMRNCSYAMNALYSDLKEIDIQRINKNLELMLQPAADNSTDVLEAEKQGMLFRDRIELRNTSYSYSKSSQPALENISLSINKGESIAIIGQSGAGKTTLIDVILGLLHPDKGDIVVDGVSIYQNLRYWQDLVGYIPQSIFLIDDTIERNIALGVPDSLIDKVSLERAIQAAQLTELIEQLPAGIQTPVGERGIRLSGGQRQRIGIARALYHEREILVLDEATASLDDETERLISKAISSLAGKKTLIIIAHRLSTIEHCDRVYQLEKGRIINSGSYQEVVVLPES